MSTDSLLTLEELAAFLKVSKDTIYRMAQKGKIPAVKVGNQWRFCKEEVLETLRPQREDEPVEKEAI